MMFSLPVLFMALILRAAPRSRPRHGSTMVERQLLANTQLLIQPGAGIGPLLKGIEEAQETIHIVMFRFDRGELEAALKRAVRRGVFVHALVAFTMSGQGGDRVLRKLETRLLADGVTVARTATDLVRYHDKLMIIDKRTLYMLGFNYTYLDIERSRSFGLITDHTLWVREAEKLFAADTQRQQYTPSCNTFLVSPGNARQQIMAMLSAASSQILIYDGKLTDPDVMKLLAAKVREGVEVRVIGSVGKRAVGTRVATPPMRLHAQVIICDGNRMFLGSQSLRSLELDARREVGVIVNDRQIIQQVMAIFETDWETSRKATKTDAALIEVPKEAVTEVDGPQDYGTGYPAEPLTTQIVKSAVREAIKDAVLDTAPNTIEETVLRDTVKEAAREALRELAV